MTRDSSGNGEVEVTTEIRGDRTVITVDGERDLAVIVNSPAGERVYLPPVPTENQTTTDSERPRGDVDSPYEGVPADSPYEGLGNASPYDGLNDDSPYAGLADQSPYEGVPADSPYEGVTTGRADASNDGPETKLGVVLTAEGFQVVHPDPATDVRLLR